MKPKSFPCRRWNHRMKNKIRWLVVAEYIRGRERAQSTTAARLGGYVLLYIARVIFINQQYSTTSGQREGMEFIVRFSLQVGVRRATVFMCLALFCRVSLVATLCDATTVLPPSPPLYRARLLFFFFFARAGCLALSRPECTRIQTAKLLAYELRSTFCCLLPLAINLRDFWVRWGPR